jgi:cellulose synthase/poly-beta-1,6-N-acetylglucosamine synthase-like glycosyltransferase
MIYLTCLLLFAGLLPIAYFSILTLAAFLPNQRPTKQQFHRFIILIPAHDEKLQIAETVIQARQQHYPKSLYRVIVIADNCTDNTAELARSAGAEVIERTGNPGKGQALYDAIGQLESSDWDAILFLDADSKLHTNALNALDSRISGGSKAIQLLYGISNPSDTIRTKAMELGQASYNGLRPRGRSRLGLSSGIYGNGFCLTRDTLQQVPYTAHSIVEDIEYHVSLLMKGICTDFCDSASVMAKMPTSAEASEKQRVRWERGRLITIKNYAPPLFKLVCSGEWRALDALIDILTPPATMTLVPLALAFILGGTAVKIFVVFAVLALLIHYFIAAAMYGNLANLWSVMLFTPRYIVWRLILLTRSFINEKNLGWERTDRE